MFMSSVYAITALAAPGTIVGWQPRMWEEWLSTFVPFGVALVLLLVLLNRIQKRRPPKPELARRIVPQKAHAEPVVVASDAPPADERAPRQRSAPRVVRSFTFRDRLNTGVKIGVPLLVAAGLFGETTIHEANWHGIIIFYLLLAGIPIVVAGSAANAALMTEARKQSNMPNIALAATVGFVSCLSLQLLAIFTPLLQPIMLGTLAAIPLFSMWGVLLPASMALLSVMVEWRLLSRAAR
jgi:hypothetical protein